MIICHSKRFIFVHIQKTGGTSVELALEPFLAWSDLLLGSSKFGEEMSTYYMARYGLNKHSSIRDIERICGEGICRDYYVFATVRHPLDRLCSLYNYVGSTVHGWATRQGISPEQVASRVAEGPPADAPSLGWHASTAFIAAASFSEFIRHERLPSDPGSRSQVSFLRSSEDGANPVRTFRLEDSSVWLPELRKTLGVEFTLPHKNRSPLRLVTREEVSLEDRKYIETWFEEDFAAFGYEP